MQFDDFALRRADVTILRGGVAAVRIEDLDLNARIPGPQGPFDGRGTFAWKGRRVAFNLASDLLAKNVLPLKASLTWPDDIGRVDLDGRVDLGKSAFEGDAKAEGRAAAGPWTAQASARLSLGGAEARDFSARLGDGPLADRVSGNLGYEAGAGQITVALDAPHLSQDWADFFAAPLTQAAKGGASFDLRLGVEDLTWRGASWSGVRLSWKAGAPAELEATGPGAARLEISATPEEGFWWGKARLQAKDFTAFAAALRAAAPPVGAPFAQGGFRAVEANGDFVASPQQWALTRGDFLFGRNRFSGALWYRPATAGKSPELTANLSSDALDLELRAGFRFRRVRRSRSRPFAASADPEIGAGRRPVGRRRPDRGPSAASRRRGAAGAAGHAPYRRRRSRRQRRLGQEFRRTARRGAAQGRRSRAARQGAVPAVARCPDPGAGGAGENPLARRSRRQGGGRRFHRQWDARGDADRHDFAARARRGGGHGRSERPRSRDAARPARRAGPVDAGSRPRASRRPRRARSGAGGGQEAGRFGRSRRAPWRISRRPRRRFLPRRGSESCRGRRRDPRALFDRAKFHRPKFHRPKSRTPAGACAPVRPRGVARRRPRRERSRRRLGGRPGRGRFLRRFERREGSVALRAVFGPCAARAPAWAAAAGQGWRACGRACPSRRF